MPAKPAQIAASAAVVLTLATGGYFANEWRVCNGLEEDYLNSMASIRGHSAIRQVLSDKALVENAKRMEEAAWKSAEGALFSLSDRCGERASQTANRKAQDILLGVSPS